jgi:hypothetical protein
MRFFNREKLTQKEKELILLCINEVNVQEIPFRELKPPSADDDIFQIRKELEELWFKCSRIWNAGMA